MGFIKSYSDHKTVRTLKPNVIHPKLYSSTLSKLLRIPITTTAFRRIRKVGGLDNYLLNTGNKTINSKLGMLIKNAIKNKIKDPNYTVPSFPKTSQTNKLKERNPRSKIYEPYIYVPKSAAFVDISPYYFKSPSQMTRQEQDYFSRVIVQS
jgi:ribosomal protein L28